MVTVNIRTAKAQFSRLVAQAAAGEEVIIAKAGKPVARLTELDTKAALPKRPLGLLAGKAVIPEDFDAPLPDDLLDLFEGR